MKIVVLDGYTENPGDLSWSELEKLGSVTAYDRTAYSESPLIAERIGDAEIVVMNKTPISRERSTSARTLSSLPFWLRATTWSITTMPAKRASPS